MSKDHLKQIGLSEWAIPIVINSKSNYSVRIYGDYKATLNTLLIIISILPRKEELCAERSDRNIFYHT